MAVKKKTTEEIPESTKVSYFKADAANRRTALFFTIIAVAGLLLFIVILNLPRTTTPTVTAPVNQTLIHNNSEIIDYSDSTDTLMYKDETGRPQEYPLASTVRITKGSSGNPQPGARTDLLPQTKIHVIVENGAVTRIHVLAD